MGAADKMDETNWIEQDDSFEIVSIEEIQEACGTSDLIHHNKKYDQDFKDTIRQREDISLSEADLAQIVLELRHLEERLHLWREVRQKSILQLKEIADYLATIGHQTGIVKVV